LGFTWLAVPHGMLEPWSLHHKRWRKSLYFRLVERRLLGLADACRGVSVSESENLDKLLRSCIVHIPNAVEWQPLVADKDYGKVRHFLFLGRLNKKKGLRELLKAWEQSEVWHNGRAALTIAGPDDGEGDLLRKWLKKSPASGSVRLRSAIYGTEKENLFRRSHFFVLPSFSEGFPTSILEALTMGLVPIVSDNCNFPELWENGLGLRANPVVESIEAALKIATEMRCARYYEQLRRGSEFVRKNYSSESIAQKQFEVCKRLLLAAPQDGD
jgi:glycosyltransferase involved in cell wall biosynthesis